VLVECLEVSSSEEVILESRVSETPFCPLLTFCLQAKENTAPGHYCQILQSRVLEVPIEELHF
jgi:hypothetical protein